MCHAPLSGHDFLHYITLAPTLIPPRILLPHHPPKLLLTSGRLYGWLAIFMMHTDVLYLILALCAPRNVCSPLRRRAWLFKGVFLAGRAYLLLLRSGTRAFPLTDCLTVVQLEGARYCF